MSYTMYIYALRDKETGKVGYVGGSKDPRKRYGQHLSGLSGHNTAKDDWIANLKDLPELEILEEVECGNGPNANGEYWTDREQFWIQYFHDEGHWLTNAFVQPPESRYVFRCKECGTTEVPHQGHGLCRNCYMRQYRHKQSLAKQYDEDDLNTAREAAYQKGFEAGSAAAVLYTDEDIEDARAEGQTQVVEAMDTALGRHNGSCVLRGDAVLLTIGGQTLRVSLQ